MSDQVVCCHVKSAPLRSLPNKVMSGYARLGQGHVLSGMVKVRSGHVRSGKDQVKVRLSQIKIRSGHIMSD